MPNLVLFFLVLIISSVSVANTVNSGVELRKIHLDTIEYKESNIYVFKPDIYLSFNHFWGSSNKDFGKKFAVLKRSSNNYKSLYESAGSGDSYILEPSFFSSDYMGGSLLVLAEVGTEYSWGLRVFLLRDSLEIEDLGTLDVAVLPESEYGDGTVSAVAYITIRENGETYEFSFSKDLVFDPG